MKFRLNTRQMFYYKRAVLGLSFYTPEQVKLMGYQKRVRIAAVHNKSKRVLSRLRYQRLITVSNDILSNYFNKGRLYDALMLETMWTSDVYLPVQLDDRELGISLEDKVMALVESGALGPNFLTMS